MKIKIIKDSDPLMRKRSLPVTLPLSEEDRDILNSMSEYLKNSQNEEYRKKYNIREGVGLAAIQIGLLKRMFVVYIDNGNNKITHYQFVNPVIIESSIRKCALEHGEGCLSVDNDHPGLVHRHYKIKIQAFNALENRNVTITATGMEAIVIQHEYDHLNGMFYYDHIDTNKPFERQNNEEII